MRKLNLENYINKIRTNEGFKDVEYFLKDSLVFMMFNRKLGLAGKDLLEQNILAEKILKAEKEIILEEAEYDKIKMAIDMFEGCGREEVELVKRVLGCSKIDIEEKK